MASWSRDKSPQTGSQSMASQEPQFNASGGQQYNNSGSGVQIAGDIHGSVHFGDKHVVQGPSLEERRTKFLRSLAPDMSSDPKSTIASKVDGTCNWCISHPLFKRWQHKEDAASNTLWISADPGCGKSVLAKHLVDDVLPLDQNCIVRSFFFKDGVTDQSTMTAALRAIVFGLLEEHPELLTDDFLRRFEIRKGALSHFEELWTILMKVSDSPNVGGIVCLLDALDECEEQSRNHFIKTLGRLSSGSRQTRLNLRFLITSRPYVEIRREMAGVSRLHLAGESEAEREEIVGEIDLVIKARVEALKTKLGLSPDEGALLLTRLRENPNRTYLWVHLVMEEIEKMILINEETITAVTTRLPLKLEGLYNQILSKSPHPSKTKELLRIVVTAARPLTQDELKEALNLQGNDWSGGPEAGQDGNRLVQIIEDMSGRFLYVAAERVHLFHQTVKEFLMESGDKATHDVHNERAEKLVWRNCLSLPQSHRTLAEICIETLLNLMTKSPQTTARNPRLKTYAAHFWALHVRGSTLKDQEKMTESILKICDGRLGRDMWLPLYWETESDRIPDAFTQLMAVSYFGIEPALSHMLKSLKVGANHGDYTYDRTALSWAAGNGQTAIVKRMLGEKRAGLLPRFKVDKPDFDGMTPLVHAARSGHTTIAELLIGAGAKLDSKDKAHRAPLLLATEQGERDMVELLLKKGANINASDEMGWTALHHAAAYGHDKLMDLLLRKGAHVDIPDYIGRTALLIATHFNQISAASRLLESRANVNAASSSGLTALHVAVEYLSTDAIDLLLQEEGLDMEAEGDCNQTPLALCAVGATWSSYLGADDNISAIESHIEVLRKLVAAGADVNCRVDDFNPTPLHYATRCGENCTRLLDSLLDFTCVDIQAKDADGHTAYTLAKELDMIETSERLAAFARSKNVTTQ